MPISPPPNGRSRTIGRPAAAPTRLPGQAPVPADAHRPRRGRRRRHRQRQGGTASHARAAAAVRCADRPGGARRSSGSLVADARPQLALEDRPAALGPAHLDLARSQDAARGHHRRGRDAARVPQCPERGEARSVATVIEEEAERLNRFIANLLDMTRIESGAIEPQGALHDVGEIVGSAFSGPARCSRSIGSRWRSRRPADAEARRGAVRTGAVQHSRQCRQICAGRLDHPPPPPGERGRRSRCRSWMRATASRRRISNGSSTSSTAYGRAIGYGRAPASALRSAAASSRRWAARIEAANRSDRRARCSPSSFAGPTDAPQLDEMHRRGRRQDPRSR